MTTVVVNSGSFHTNTSITSSGPNRYSGSPGIAPGGSLTTSAAITSAAVMISSMVRAAVFFQLFRLMATSIVCERRFSFICVNSHTKVAKEPPGSLVKSDQRIWRRPKSPQVRPAGVRTAGRGCSLKENDATSAAHGGCRTPLTRLAAGRQNCAQCAHLYVGPRFKRSSRS